MHLLIIIVITIVITYFACSIKRHASICVLRDHLNHTAALVKKYEACIKTANDTITLLTETNCKYQQLYTLQKRISKAIRKH